MLKATQQGLLFILLTLLWVTPAVSSAADELPPPEKVIESVFNQAVDALLENQDAIREDAGVAYALIDEILSPHVHFRLMTQLVLGRHSRDASEEQLERFMNAFHESTIRTYATMLSDNVDAVVRTVETSGQVVTLSEPSPPDQRGRVNVPTRLNVGDSPIPVFYRMIATDDGWRVYDVVIENISFVTNYREEYASEIRRGSLEQLINRLEQRNERARNR